MGKNHKCDGKGCQVDVNSLTAMGPVGPKGRCLPWMLWVFRPWLSQSCSTYFVGSCESCPGFVCPPVVVLRICHFHVVAEADEDLPLT